MRLVFCCLCLSAAELSKLSWWVSIEHERSFDHLSTYTTKVSPKSQIYFFRFFFPFNTPSFFGEGLPLLSFRLHLQFKWAITVYSFSHWETLAANDFHVSLGIIVIISTRIFGSPNFCSHLGSSLVLGLARKNISILIMSWLFACKTCKQGHKNEGHGSPSQLSLWPKSRVSKMTTSFKGTKKKWSQTFSRTLEQDNLDVSITILQLHLYFL